MGATSASFAELRKLAAWFASPAVERQGAQRRIAPRLDRLGAVAVPLLGRELRHADAHRRDAARESLARLAASAGARARVLDELRRVIAEPVADDTKVCALGLLAELGEPTTATFADPLAMQRRSALALAAQLDTPADIASAADLMVRQLGDSDMLQMIAILVEAAPQAARRLAAELAIRLDLAAEPRERVAAAVAELPESPASRAASEPGLPRRAPRPSYVAVLEDPAGRIVVVANRKISGERRWRRWAVLIGSTGRIDDCLHEDDADDDSGEAAGTLVATLCADGYRIASRDLERARSTVVQAARATATNPAALGSAYYLGRDVLDLRDAHLAGRRRDAACRDIDRAHEALGAGDLDKALALLARCDADSSDVAAALGAALLAKGEHVAALEWLARAVAAEPHWPLHHWNLAVARFALGDTTAATAALRRFLDASSVRPSPLVADAEQDARLATAERYLRGDSA